MEGAALQVLMAPQVQARLVMGPLERTIQLVLILQTWPTRLILALIAIVVCYPGGSKFVGILKINLSADGRSGTSGAYGSSGTGTTGYGSTGTHNTAGPHSSDLANKADPRVDSDRGKWPWSLLYSLKLTLKQTGRVVLRDHTAPPGQAHLVTDLLERTTPPVLTPQTWPIKPILVSIVTAVSVIGLFIISTKPNYGADGRSGTSGAYGTTGSGTTGYGSTGTGTSGYGSTGTHRTAGPHSSDLGNKADPRVDSDLGVLMTKNKFINFELQLIIS